MPQHMKACLILDKHWQIRSRAAYNFTVIIGVVAYSFFAKHMHVRLTMPS
jgi:hypothetical protein